MADTTPYIEVRIKSDAPFSILLTPRPEHAPLFSIVGSGTLDASWIPVLIQQLKEAQKHAKLLDDSPKKGKK